MKQKEARKEKTRKEEKRKEEKSKKEARKEETRKEETKEEARKEETREEEKSKEEARKTLEEAAIKIQEQMDIPKSFSYRRIPTRSTLSGKYDALVSRLSRAAPGWEDDNPNKRKVKPGIKNLKKRTYVEVDDEDDVDPKFFKSEEDYLPFDESYSECSSDEEDSDDDLERYSVKERQPTKDRQVKKAKK